MSSSETCLLSITARDNYSELYLEDERYSVIAKGFGMVLVRVPPGIYRIRQRIGGQEHCQLIDVRAGRINEWVLEALPFASPIPLSGGRASQDSQQTALGSQEHTAPGIGPSPFSLLLRDSRETREDPATVPISEVELEARRIRIESLDGTFTRRLDEIGKFDPAAGYLRACIGLKPGAYVLTQQMADGLKRHMMLPIQEKWCLHLFMEVPPPGSSPPDLDLDRAAVVYADPKTVLQPDDAGLALLEVARKALARGRADVAPEIVDRILAGKSGNPILGLLGSYLLLSTPRPDVDLTKRIFDRTSELLGNTFPDVIALQLRLARLDPTQSLPDARPTHPPLLAASWATLLAWENERGRDDISGFFSSAFTVEPTTTWFVWNEAQRAQTESVSSGSSRRSITFRSPRRSPKTPPLTLPNVIKGLLEEQQLQPWLRALKDVERAGKPLPEELSPLDRDLLAALSSAQASLIPGVIEAETAANTIVRGLRVPASVARESAARLATGLRRWIEDAGTSSPES